MKAKHLMEDLRYNLRKLNSVRSISVDGKQVSLTRTMKHDIAEHRIGVLIQQLEREGDEPSAIGAFILTAILHQQETPNSPKTFASYIRKTIEMCDHLGWGSFLPAITSARTFADLFPALFPDGASEPYPALVYTANRFIRLLRKIFQEMGYPSIQDMPAYLHTTYEYALNPNPLILSQHVTADLVCLAGCTEISQMEREAVIAFLTLLAVTGLRRNEGLLIKLGEIAVLDEALYIDVSRLKTYQQASLRLDLSTHLITGDQLQWLDRFVTRQLNTAFEQAEQAINARAKFRPGTREYDSAVAERVSDSYLFDMFVPPNGDEQAANSAVNRILRRANVDTDLHRLRRYAINRARMLDYTLLEVVHISKHTTYTTPFKNYLQCLPALDLEQLDAWLPGVYAEHGLSMHWSVAELARAAGYSLPGMHDRIARVSPSMNEKRRVSPQDSIEVLADIIKQKWSQLDI